MFKYLLILLVSINCYADSFYCYDKCNSKDKDYYVSVTGQCYCTQKLSDKVLETIEPISEDESDELNDLNEIQANNGLDFSIYGNLIESDFYDNN